MPHPVLGLAVLYGVPAGALCVSVVVRLTVVGARRQENLLGDTYGRIVSLLAEVHADVTYDSILCQLAAFAGGKSGVTSFVMEDWTSS